MKEGTYLRIAYKAFENGIHFVGPSYVAKELGISKVTAYEALLKLAKMNYGSYIPKKGFVLNKNGIKVGKDLTRKHRLIECFLAELNLDADRICKEATNIECFVSDFLIEALEKKYGNKETCPCGHSLKL